MTTPRYALEVSSPPEVEPIDLAQAKNHCKVEIPDEDDQFLHWIRTARRLSESLLGAALITQTHKVYLDEFPEWEFVVPRGPLQSVTSIVYTATDGTSTTLSASAYQADAKSVPGRITPSYGNVWPTAREQMNAVCITCVVGYGDAGDDVPDEIRRAMYLAVATWNFHREQTPTELPVGVQSLLLSCWDGRY